VPEPTIFLGLTAADIVTLLSALMAALVIAAGWFITNRLAQTLATRNRREETRVAYIVDAYEKLANAANRAMTPEHARMIEQAIAKIQLLGTNEEIAAVGHFLDTWDKPQPDGIPRGDLDPLLSSLRNSLREQLSLSKVSGPIRWIRPMGGRK
jgi:hypothetical protein